jgi:signal transduction histidine kinase
MTEGPRRELITSTFLFQLMGMAVFLVFLVGAYAAVAHGQELAQGPKATGVEDAARGQAAGEGRGGQNGEGRAGAATYYIIAWGCVLVGLGLWTVLALFVSFRLIDIVEWVLFRMRVLPHDPESVVQYGVPRGFERFADLIDQRGSQTLLVSALQASWLIVHEFGRHLALVNQATDHLENRLSSPGAGGEEVVWLRQSVDGARKYYKALRDWRDGKLQLLELVDLRAVLEKIRDNLLDHRDRLEIIGPKGDGPALVHGIEAFLEAVLQNLVNNAFEHNPPGGRVYVILATETRHDGEWLSTRVEDEGPELSEEKAKEIFRPPIVTLADREAGRRGLGLPLGRVLVELHGGALNYEPPVGGGRKALVATLPSAGPGTWAAEQKGES